MRLLLTALVFTLATLTAQSGDETIAEFGSAKPSAGHWLVQSFRIETQIEAPRPTGEYLDANLEAVDQPLPEFPAVCLNAGVVGEATVSFVINSEGQVETIATVSRTHQEFADSAVKAVRRWRFKPIAFHGEPTSLPVLTRFIFSIAVDKLSKDDPKR